MSFYVLATLGVLFGIGFGFFVQRSGLCFSHGLGEIYIGGGRRILRLFLVIFIITSLGFMISAYVSPELGLKPIGQIRGFGFYNLVSGMLFGAGIALCGGCILGTLRQIGEGNMTFLIVLACFAPGMALVVYVLNPLLDGGYNVQNVCLPETLGVSAPYITLTLVALASVALYSVSKRKSRAR